MPTYLFQLGRAAELSTAEIIAVNQRMGSPLSRLEPRGEALLADADSDAPVRALCEELGGTVRFAETGAQLAPDAFSPEALAERLFDSETFSFLKESGDKTVFGLSLFGDTEPLGGKRKVHGLLHDAAAAIKTRMQETGGSVRFVLPESEGDSWLLTGAQVDRNNLFKRGGEILIHASAEKGFTLARTAWLQDYEAFSTRDYGRPERDARSGMLPPKLARMMLNLARTAETRTVLDPFCGSGGVLMEAALMGLTPVGIDLSEKAVNDAIANGQWLQKRFGLGNSPKVILGDARTLHKLAEPLYFDACVSEPDLGPPLRRPLQAEKFRDVSNKLSDLYRRALAEMRTVTRPGGRVVFIIPRFALEDRDEPGRINLLGDIRLMGYTPLDPLNGFEPASGRASLLYYRPKQFVQREIFVLRA
ncbi:MAG: methyltransferase domain-containing protein [bacterium]|nr:methyltransferase domain-containing protein [bacterium]